MPVQWSGSCLSRSGIGERVSKRMVREEWFVPCSKALTMRALGWRAEVWLSLVYSGSLRWEC